MNLPTSFENFTIYHGNKLLREIIFLLQVKTSIIRGFGTRKDSIILQSPHSIIYILLMKHLALTDKSLGSKLWCQYTHMLRNTNQGDKQK